MNLYRHLKIIAIIYCYLKIIRKWNGIRFLCYHGVVDKIANIHPIRRSAAISTSEFRLHLEYLRQNQILVLSMDEALYLLSNGDVSKNKYACITFDDGYLDNFTNAWLILKEYEYPAHFFAVSDFIGKREFSTIDCKKYCRSYMDDEHIKQFVEEGGSIGSHGKNHLIMTKLDFKEIVYQAEKSKDTLQNITGKDVNTFAYPSARYNKLSIKALKSAGYSHAFDIGFGSVKLLNGDNRYRIRRNILLNNHEEENLLTIRGCYDWAKGYSYASGLLRSMRKA